MERRININFTPSLLKIGVLLIFALIMRIQLIPTKNADPYRYTTPTEYFLYVPENYTPDKTYPLWVHIHSDGDNGRHGCWNHLQRHADEYGFILLCPTLNQPGHRLDYDRGVSLLNPMIDQVRQRYNVHYQVYLSGYSGGAYFIQKYAHDYPANIAGLAIMSPNAYYEKSNTMLKSVPILITRSGVNAEKKQVAQTYYDSLTATGFSARLEVRDSIWDELSQGVVRLALEQYRMIYP